MKRMKRMKRGDIVSWVVLSLVLACCGLNAAAGQVILEWRAPTENVDGSSLSDLAGYKVYQGPTSGSYTGVTDVGDVTQVTMDGIAEGATTYFAVSTYNSAGTESALSAEATATPMGEATATQSGNGYRPGETTLVNAEFAYPVGASVLSLRWQPYLPAGWTLAQVSGDGSPEVFGDEIVFSGQLTNAPVVFQYGVNVPVGVSGTQSLSAEVHYALLGMINPVTVAAQPESLAIAQLQTLSVVSEYGGATPASGISSFANGTVVDCAVTTSPLAAGTGVRRVSTGWNGSGSVPETGTGTAVQVALTTDSSLTWNWVTEYDLQVAAGANGQVSAVSGWYAEGGPDVAVSATPAADYSFAGWSGDVPAGQEQSNPLMLPVDRPRSVTASFAIDTLSLTVVSAYGVPSPSAGVNSYAFGSDVVCTINDSPETLDAGIQVVSTGWIGAGSVPASGTGTRVDVVLDADSSIAWQWKTQYLFAATAEVGGTVTGSSGGWYDRGETLSVTATPRAGFEFAGWTGDVTAGQENQNPLSLTVDGPSALTAQFTVASSLIYAGHETDGHRSPSAASVVSGSFVYPSGESLTALSWAPELPAGWSLVSASGDGAPAVVGSEIVFSGPFSGDAVAFTYSVAVPGNAPVSSTLGGTATFQLAGMSGSADVRAMPDPLSTDRLHSADYAAPYGVIDGAELNRALAYWRAGGYYNEPAGYDGYAATTTPEIGNTAGGLHSADYLAPYRQIDGTEIGRVLAYWRAGGYTVSDSGPDGYIPSAAAPLATSAMVQSFTVAEPVDGVSATQIAPAVYDPGETLTVTNALTFDGQLLSLCWRPQLPEGWRLLSARGDGTPEAIRGEIVWTGALPPSPVHVEYTVAIPAWACSQAQITAAVDLFKQFEANPITRIADPSVALLVPADLDGDGLADAWERAHSADAGDLSPDVDGDGDGMDNRGEYLAGTAPDNQASVLSLTGVAGGRQTGRSIAWQSAEGRSYVILRSTSGMDAFEPIAAGIHATSPQNTFLDSEALDGAGPCFYKVELMP